MQPEQSVGAGVAWQAQHLPGSVDPGLSHVPLAWPFCLQTASQLEKSPLMQPEQSVGAGVAWQAQHLPGSVDVG